MGRIRTIKPDFFKHEELYQLEKETKLPVRLAFIGLWTVADREGRFKWRPNQLKIDCLPYDNVDFSRVLDALATRGFITEYCEVDVENSEKYGFIETFLDNQVINNREMESKLLSPFDACVTRDPRGLCNTKWKGRERKGKEDAPKAQETLIPDDFSISDNVREWAKKKNIKSLDVHFESFVNVCIAKGYKYIDWDRAFMEAIRKNWAKVSNVVEVPDWKKGLL
jgi:hypothetical protein